MTSIRYFHEDDDISDFIENDKEINRLTMMITYVRVLSCMFYGGFYVFRLIREICENGAIRKNR